MQRYYKSIPEFRGPHAHALEDLLAVGQHPALRAEVVGLGVDGPRFWQAAQFGAPERLVGGIWGLIGVKPEEAFRGRLDS